MSAIVMNGEGMVQPISSHARSSAWTLPLISTASLSSMRPAMGSSTRLTTAPSATTTWPPPHAASVLAASAMSASFVPTTSRLCASCATVDAMAPRLMPKPFTKPQPNVPVAWWRSNTKVLSTSFSGSAWMAPSMTGSRTCASNVPTLPGMISMARTVTACAPSSAAPSGSATVNVSGVISSRRCMECVTQSGYSNGASWKHGAPSSAATSPSIMTRETRKSVRSPSRNTMSAHLPGVMDPRSWSIWKHCAVLMVTICTAVIGSMPHCTAVRRMWSRWPSATNVCGCVSSDTRQAKRVSTLPSETA